MLLENYTTSKSRNVVHNLNLKCIIPIEVDITMLGLNRRRYMNWSQTAEITVSNAPKIDPNARVISIRKNSAEKKLDPSILVTTSGYAINASPGPPLTT